jgi:methylenetetrahydrofolate reductase (NADPH)
MKLTRLFAEGGPALSFEVFPPKAGNNYESVRSATEAIAGLRPAFMSVTCGAGGSTEGFTVSIAKNLKDKFGVTPLVHLICISSTEQEIESSLLQIRDAGIKNILALRGDMPKYDQAAIKKDFRYACDLVAKIKRFGDFCVGGACYPEGHPEAPNFDEDINNLRVKVDAGCDFLVSQMFFDNNIFYAFLDKLAAKGINVPVIPGIMPVTNAKQIRRILELSGRTLPRKFAKIVDRFGDDPEAMKQAGIVYATEQVVDLYASGIKNVHIYTMNKPEVAARVMDNISAIIKTQIFGRSTARGIK